MVPAIEKRKGGGGKTRNVQPSTKAEGRVAIEESGKSLERPGIFVPALGKLAGIGGEERP